MWEGAGGFRLPTRLGLGARKSIARKRVPTRDYSLPVSGPAAILPLLCRVGLPDKGGFKMWRGVRVAEGARLESVYTVKRIAGSNPALSAILMSENCDDLRVRRND